MSKHTLREIFAAERHGAHAINDVRRWIFEEENIRDALNLADEILAEVRFLAQGLFDSRTRYSESEGRQYIDRFVSFITPKED